jgi:hypothetical protein
MQNHFMSRAALLGGAVCVLGAAGSSDAQNILTNGSLDDTYQQLIVDNPDPGPPPDLFLPKPTTWINEGSRAITGPYEDELSSEPWAGPSPTPVTAGSNATFPPGAGLDAAVFFKAFSGNLANGPATGHLYQDKPAVPGATYTLTGWAGAEPNYLAQQTVFAIEFLNGSNAVIGGTTLDLVAAGLFTDNGLAFDYKQYSLNAVAPAGSVLVRARVSMIGGAPNPAGGGQAFVVDDFVLVPEPASVSAIALGCLAPLARRRRTR